MATYKEKKNIYIYIKLKITQTEYNKPIYWVRKVRADLEGKLKRKKFKF